MDIKDIRDLYPFEPHYHPIRNHRCHYVDEGKGDTLLMLHGNPTWSFYYRNLILAARENYRVVAPDHLGCGLSDKPQKGPYRLETHIDNLESLVQSVCPGEVTIVAHDWGGAIGMGLAKRRPDKVKRIMLMNTGAFAMASLPLRIRLCKSPGFGQFLTRRLNLFCRAATFMTTTKPLPQRVKQAYLMPYRSYADRVAIYNFVKDIPLSGEHESFEPLLSIEHSLWMFRKTPVCLVWGMRDWCFTPAFLDKWLEFFPQARVLRLEDAGHYVLEDAPEVVIPFFLDFLNDFK